MVYTNLPRAGLALHSACPVPHDDASLDSPGNGQEGGGIFVPCPRTAPM